MTDTIQTRKMLELLFFEKLQALEDDPLKKLDALFRIADQLLERNTDKEDKGRGYTFKESLSQETWEFIREDMAGIKKEFLISLCFSLIKGTVFEPFYITPKTYPTVRYESSLTRKGRKMMKEDWMEIANSLSSSSEEQKYKLFSLLEEHFGITTWMYREYKPDIGIRTLPKDNTVFQLFIDMVDPPAPLLPRTISFAERKYQIEKLNYVGEILSEERKSRKWTQQIAADKLGVTQAQWSAYELGKNRPNLDVLILIAVLVFEITPQELCKKCLQKLEEMQK